MAMVVASSSKTIDLNRAIERAHQVHKALASQSSLYLGRKFTLISDIAKKANFTDLMIDLGALIFQAQKQPKEDEVSGLVRVIQDIALKEEPSRGGQLDRIAASMLKAAPHIWQLGQPKSQEKIQHAVMKLFLAKEFLVFCAHYASVSRKVIACDRVRYAFWQVIPKDFETGIGIWSPLLSSGFSQMCSKSRQAFALFVKHANYLTQSVQSKNPQHSRCIKSLRKHLKGANSPDEAQVGRILLVQIEADRENLRFNRILLQYLMPCYIQRCGGLWDPLLKGVLPNFVNVLREISLVKGEGHEFERAENPKHLNLLNRLEEEYKKFSEAHEESNTIYRVFYQIFENKRNSLSAKEREAFENSYIGIFQHSIAWCNKQKMPTPQEFAEMKPESFEELTRDDAMHSAPSRQSTVVPTRINVKKKKKLPVTQVSKAQDGREPVLPPQHKTELSSVPAPAAAVMPDKTKTIELGPAATLASKPLSFKDIIAQGEYPIKTYDARVNRWFENPGAALAKADPTGKKDPNHLVRVHTFPLFLDNLIGTRYCIAGKCKNAVGKESDLFCLVGEIVNLKTSEVDTGVLSIAVDEDRVCWHRAWAWMTKDEIVNGILSGLLYKITNPTPAEANTRDKGMARSAMTKMDDIPVTLDGAGIITIPIDATHTLHLFPCDI